MDADEASSQWNDTSRRVAYTELGDKVNISTVFLPMDHGFSDNKPAWFETMIFGGTYDQCCDRYETINEAEAGHNRVVARLIAGLTPFGEDKTREGDEL